MPFLPGPGPLVSYRVGSAPAAGSLQVLAVDPVNGVATVSAAVVRVRTLAPVVAAVATVSVALVRVRTLVPAANGAATVTATVVRTRVLNPVVSGVATVTATVVRARAFTAAINGVATVSAAVAGSVVSAYDQIIEWASTLFHHGR